MQGIFLWYSCEEFLSNPVRKKCNTHPRVLHFFIPKTIKLRTFGFS